jgi:hypothetical protein
MAMLKADMAQKDARDAVFRDKRLSTINELGISIERPVKKNPSVISLSQPE